MQNGPNANALGPSDADRFVNDGDYCTTTAPKFCRPNGLT
jgi:hypothetical protein